MLDALQTWLGTTLATLSKQSATAKAIRYELTRWPALTRYVNDGQLEIDNNAAERALRGVALGRRNCLFAGADSCGELAAAINTLIGTAKLNGLDREAYLRHVIGVIADHSVNRVDELLPWAVTDQTPFSSKLNAQIASAVNHGRAQTLTSLTQVRNQLRQRFKRPATPLFPALSLIGR